MKSKIVSFFKEHNIPPATALLILLNVIVFLVMEFGGDSFSARILSDYGMSWPRITVRREWYRLFTACFLHFGLEHLGSNMLMLALMGDRLEKTLGSLKFTLVYLISGLAGTASSMLLHMQKNEPVLSAGASGAIYGVTGALFGFLTIRGGFVDGVGLRQMVVMILFMVYTSTVGDSVDLAAHAGGLAAGFLLGLLFALLSRKKRL